MLDAPLTILTLAAPLLIGCGTRLLLPAKKLGVVLALVLATLIIPGRNFIDMLIFRSAEAIEVGWGFAVLYGLITGMIGIVLAELITGRRERRAREKQWQAENPPSKPETPKPEGQ